MSVLALRHKLPTPDQLLFRSYKLSLREKLLMTAWGTALSQLANPVGNSVYFGATQLRYGLLSSGGVGFVVDYPKRHQTYMTLGFGSPRPGGAGVSLYLGDAWDRLPVHLEHLLHVSWWAGQAAPGWWVTARHDVRYVLVGVIAMLMIKCVTVGLGKKGDRKQVSKWRVLSSPLTVGLAALVAAVPGILLFTRVPVAEDLARHGLFSNNAYLGAWIGSGKWELTLIGLTAGYVAKFLFAPVAATVQLVSIDRKLARGDTEKWWWRLVYTPAYLHRFRYLLNDHDHVPVNHGRALTVFLMAFAFFFAVALPFGLWLRYFGPAKGA
jgi:hypothetical protein